MNKIKKTVGKFDEFIRYGSPFKKALAILIPLSIIAFILSLHFIIPNMDKDSIQAGLTIVAEIQGVMLGVVLVILGVLVEQGKSSEEILRQFYPKYRHLMEDKIQLLHDGLNEFRKSIDDKDIELHDSIYIPKKGHELDTKYKDVLGYLIALLFALEPYNFEKYQLEFGSFGYSEKEKDRYLFGKGVTAAVDPVDFFEVVVEATTPIVHWFNKELNGFCSDLFTQLMNEGILKALGNQQKSEKLIRSKVLTITISCLVIFTGLPVLIIFGVVDAVIPILSFRIVIASIQAGFVTSVIMTLILLGNLVD